MQELYAHKLSKQAEEGLQEGAPPHSSQVTLSSLFGNKHIQALAAQNQCATIGAVNNICESPEDLRNKQTVAI